ncbi:uncharacterized protein APUU_30164S [Aspergillus puulaauensis]|uniref:NAD(P)-binding protein n=1 Tax=Aspergillus puulaauensis TaxID=1220207 RepID=A0A7R8AJM9_9EURO|nr:uncharacterized protein APUU_30164S [Aspergillus puulaauensis]BCS21939.1 hypothetical protein APUU_30164S [Aspergillus puulaauensis]
MPSLANFLYTQLFLQIPIPTTPFTSKTVLITGASSGLGKETAKHIARLGATKIILGCRSISKGEAAAAEIHSAVHCSADIFEVWQLDLESPDSVKSFVDRANKLPRLDFVINNAGLQAANYAVSYGTERTIAVNVIGTFLLAVQLVPKLKETARVYRTTPHMTFVGSELYGFATYPEEHGDDLFGWFGERRHGSYMMNQYNLSKLLLLYGVIQLSQLVDKSEPSTPVMINSLDPCFCKTNLPGEMSGALGVFFKPFELLFARSAEEGSRLIVMAAAGGQESHGRYFRSAELKPYVPFVSSDDGVKRREYVWDQLCRRLEGLQPGIMGKLGGI